MRIAMLGAGAWGTALAVHTAPRHDVLLWARDARQAEAMRRFGVNARYLPGVSLPATLRVGADLAAALDHGRSGLVVIATPMSALAEMLRAVPDGAGVLWLCKGFEAGSGRLGHEIVQALHPGLRAGVLSGPSFAEEVAQALPTALVAASSDAALTDEAVAAFHSDTLRVYTSDDPVGVEVGGAVKNVMAIATGVCDGLQLGQNARAALITRGLAEMTRLGVALGARAETFMGLSGLGDLVLTATGDLSRNRRVGLRLAAGQALGDVLAALGHVAEGVYSARTVLQRARAVGVAMPVTEAVVALLDGTLTPAQAVTRLMARQARAESGEAQTPPA
ncbi:MAG: NAD(P)H-dependent glycerol-3-phosphate dehydrogenase [Gammaproteobacteria bacterium]|uniref:NAD(P)H-dependent glycerol-3-phosphate dehydrogenase n=1 Tax=Azohydromonas sp. TaxID=1872666 RepID=UPI002C9F2A9F|nr:NAD(P)H-dependent glycerol-3-phosphate dehydrogenase [Azohydromonas sp.]HMM85405.1 NAD(P)H-dependent glycerol-3-phosphate dehydrogenase [Azohydromonas sp.]